MLKFKYIFLALSVLACIAFFTIDYEQYEYEVAIAKRMLKSELGLIKEKDKSWLVRKNTAPNKITINEGVKPFIDIGESLGDLASHWEGTHVVTRGVTVFDANGDGRLDIFFANPQRVFAKEVEDNLLNSAKPMEVRPNALFLNQGNDEAGNPVFKSVQELQLASNKTNVQEELLFEGKYKPRRSVEDAPSTVGRIGMGAISADFNADGLMDLYLLNGNHGMEAQIPELGFVFYPAGENLGRDRKENKLTFLVPSFLRQPIEDGTDMQVNYNGNLEYEARNTLYINMGDSDGDGIPEWKDITTSANVGGQHHSTGAAVSDIDRDGDLDMYVSNFLDPDYYAFGQDRFAGHRNQLYINQLSETGELSFKQVAEEYKVAGLHEEEGLSSDMYFSSTDENENISKQIIRGEQVGEMADHSWTAHFHDWSKDGYPDLIVSTDLGNRLRLYENENGKSFKYHKEFDSQVWQGCWMGIGVGDLDLDMEEEIMVTNCGSQLLSIGNTRLLINDQKERGIIANSSINYTIGMSTHNHVLLKYNEGKFENIEHKAIVDFSENSAPDQTNINNIEASGHNVYKDKNFKNSLTGAEFAWNSPLFDIENDGDLDVYLVGASGRGNDSLSGDQMFSPGRVLVNESTPNNLKFKDLTLEYRLFDIQHMDYEYNPPRRNAPGTGWHKRDYIYLTDRGSYSGAGVDASKSYYSELFQMHEHGGAAVSADINGDGFQDIILPRIGGYNSNSPEARNLKVDVAGRKMAIPAISPITSPPTGFEEGKTSVFINSNKSDSNSNWVKIRLVDRTGFNRSAIGAKLTINDKYIRNVTATQGHVMGSVSEDLHVGLGEGSLEKLDVIWPDGKIEKSVYQFDKSEVNKIVCIDKIKGIFNCEKS